MTFVYVNAIFNFCLVVSNLSLYLIIMSSSSNSFIDLFNELLIYMHRIGDSILVALGIISCVLSLIIFTQKDLRKSPCAIYFVVHNIANLFYIFFVILVTLLQRGYSIDPGSYNLAYCHLRFYFYYLFGALSPFYLILASVDRILSTSLTIRIRQYSTRRVAYVAVAIMTLFWMIFHIHTLIYINIYQSGPYSYSCSYAPGSYIVFVNYYQLVVRGLFAPLLMLFFSLLTVKNIRSAHRIAPAPDSTITRIPVANGPQNFTRERSTVHFNAIY
jgi:hypothetical protein